MTKLTSFFATLALVFTYLFGLGVSTVSEGYELAGNKKLPATVSMYSGQGLCYDGENFYSSGSLMKNMAVIISEALTVQTVTYTLLLRVKLMMSISIILSFFMIAKLSNTQVHITI